nr:uncharacterized protein LOC129269245 isoform X1 [Lytechinus pictus]
MVSSVKRGVRRNLFSTRNSSFTSPWSTNKAHTTLFTMLAAFIGGQILLTGVFLMRAAPPCDCRCQWRPDLEMTKAKAARSIASVSTEISGHHIAAGNSRPKDAIKLDEESIPNPRKVKIPTDHAVKHVDSDLTNKSSKVEKQDTMDMEPLQGFGIPDPFTILTTTNTAFSDLTENWLESLRRLERPYNITLIAEDYGAYQYLNGHRDVMESSKLQINLRFTDQNVSHSKALGFYTKEYIQLVGKRPHYILDILRTGAGVLFADADAVWLKDPVPLISETYSKYDIWVALGEGGQIPCPCFMYIKPSPRSTAMVKAWQARIEDQLNTTSPENDQGALDWVMHNHIRYKRLRVRKLDMTAFPTGQSMFLKKGWYAAHKNEIYVVHANKVGGYAKKKFVLKWKKLWFLGKDNKENGTRPKIDM